MFVLPCKLNIRAVLISFPLLRLCRAVFLVLALLSVAIQSCNGEPDLPVLKLTADPTVITQSCRIIIPAGTIIPNSDSQGAVQIGASNIELRFEPNSILRGSQLETTPDRYQGCGIRLNGHSGVTIRGARISGYACGLWASKADGLLLEDIDASDNRRAHLKSTPVAEDESDWLFGHENDHHEWLTNYGAALYIEQSRGITVRHARVWHGQNALCLDRVSGGKIYDNDFSFNSGWGIALWRCNSNLISRNALDFCIRGYSHGVYNRGQDSAGILVFEQNNKNIFIENSATHGGDGFFGFAGREAIGESGEHPVEWYRRRGNSDNILIGNDFSYAAAHGIENTFSFGNKYLTNRIAGNAICGIWAGYSRQTLIAGNRIEQNGDMGYGLERGGVDIDHGGDNYILYNSFVSNKCGVHLWGGPNPQFAEKNWAKANGYASTGSIICDNVFNGDELAFHFRGPGEVTLDRNQLIHVSKEMIDEPAYVVRPDSHKNSELVKTPDFEIIGSNHPVGARPELRGRQNIIMTEWGPWDHLTPIARLIKYSGASITYEVRKVPTTEIKTEIVGAQARCVIEPVAERPGDSHIIVSSSKPGVCSFVLKIQAAGKPLASVIETLVSTKWEVTFFRWPTNIDPRSDLLAYRKLAYGPTAISDQIDELSFRYGNRGPSDLQISDKITGAKIPSDHFGMIARTRLPITKGIWRLTTLSDDGVRVTVEDKPVIENWTWHGPTRDTGQIELENDKAVEITVEHFQIDGYAVLEFRISRESD